MFGRYTVVVCDLSGNIIFQGYFQSINRLAKVLCCFDENNVDIVVIDVITDRSVNSNDLIDVFRHELIIL